MKITMMILAILIYMGVMIYIGVRCSKQNKSSDDFYLGGRKLGPLVTAMSAEASDMSSWLLMGLPGVALISGVINPGGFAEAVWTAVGLAIGTYINWLIVAKPIRIYTEKTNSATLPDFFSARFGDKKGILTAAAAVFIVVFFIPYTASGFAGIGKLFNTLFGVDYVLAMAIGAIVVIGYTVAGGFLAASQTDFVQSIVMTFALFVIICFGIENAGGLAPIKENILAIDGIGSLGQYFSLTGTDGSYSFLPIVSTLAWGLGYFGMPHILLRFMAIEDSKKLKLSRRVASVWVVISMAIAIFIGVIGLNFVLSEGWINLAGETAEGFDAERIVIYFAKDGIANLDSFAAIIAGLILSGILASTMSTADSQLLAASSSVSENIVKRFIWKDMGVKWQMWLARLTVVAISVIAFFLALNPDASIFRIVSFAWAGFGAAFGPVVLCALFWRRTNKWGALAGMVSGAVMVFVWKFVVRTAAKGTFLDIYELLPAFLVSLAAIVIVSLLTAEPEQEILNVFDEVKALCKKKDTDPAAKENA
ncbi:MAG: sodium/proline symporter [Clostridia bacterium]|nr:sodium/proline symporter [Clostridia bacterium]